jgi:hypothetical protein
MLMNDQERWKEADDLASKALLDRPMKRIPLGSAGALLLDFPGVKGAARYRRGLDLDNAITVSTFGSNGVSRDHAFMARSALVATVRQPRHGMAPASRRGSGAAHRGAAPGPAASGAIQHRPTDRDRLRPEVDGTTTDAFGHRL